MTQRFSQRHTLGIFTVHSLPLSTFKTMWNASSPEPSRSGYSDGDALQLYKAEKDKPYFLEESESLDSWNVANTQWLPLLKISSYDVKFSVISFPSFTRRELIFHFLLAWILFPFSVSPYPTSQFHKVPGPGNTAICYLERCTMVNTFHPMTPSRRPHPPAAFLYHSLINSHCVLDTQLAVQIFRNKC